MPTCASRQPMKRLVRNKKNTVCVAAQWQHEGRASHHHYCSFGLVWWLSEAPFQLIGDGKYHKYTIDWHTGGTKCDGNSSPEPGRVDFYVDDVYMVSKQTMQPSSQLPSPLYLTLHHRAGHQQCVCADKGGPPHALPLGPYLQWPLLVEQLARQLGRRLPQRPQVVHLQHLYL